MSQLCLDCQTLIVGSGLTGALLTYTLSEQLDNIIYLEYDHNEIDDNVEVYDLDIELKKLSQYVHPDDVDILFHFLLNAIYKLESITTILGDCDYQRLPNLVYGKRPMMDYNRGYVVYPNLLTYYSGVTFNAKKLMQQIKNFCFNKRSVQVFSIKEIHALEIDHHQLTLKTNAHIINAKQLILLRAQDGELFLSELNQELPTLIQLAEYPHVFLNTGNYSLLNGLIFGNFLSKIIDCPGLNQTIIC